MYILMPTLEELRREATELKIPFKSTTSKSYLEQWIHEAKQPTCPRCLRKVDTLHHVLEYYPRRAYHAKYGTESDSDPTLIIDDTLPKIYYKYQYNGLPIKPSDYEWRRRAYYGFYETYRLRDVCQHCLTILDPK